MAFSQAEQNALAPLLRREGVDTFIDEVRAIEIKEKRDAATTALGSSVSVTVSDWKAAGDAVAQASSSALPALLADLDAAVAAKDATKLGALYVQLHGAIKKHLSL